MSPDTERPADTVLFDLDGTLVDSAAGILGALHTAFEELGLQAERAALGPHLLGPPLYTTLPRIVADQQLAARAVTVYREHYARTGVYDNDPYPGVVELLAGLRERGVRLALATSKAEVYAERILDQHGWSELFTAVTGDTLDAARPTKAAVVAEALRRLGSPAPERVVMVGDRSHDVVGSGAHGIACVGVGWGYAEPGELAAAGAATIVDTPADLGRELIGRVSPAGSSARG